MMSASEYAERENPLLAAALAYARHGFPVFPCRPRGKEPLTHHGVKDATTDPEQIRRRWQRWPDANIAIATGGASGIIALDVDPRHGGDVSLDMLEFEHGPLPATVVQHTPGGGKHYLFRHPGGTIRNSAGEVGPGLDIKADGGYILVEPSVGANGRPYEFEVEHSLDRIELAPLPAWLLAKLQASNNGPRQHRDEEEEPIREGQRNAVLFRLACSMRAKGMSSAAILAALLTENAARCQPPLDEDEVQKIAASASRYEPGRTHARYQRYESAAEAEEEPVVSDPPWPELAEEALYGLPGDIVRTIDPYTEADPVATLLNTLVACGNCINSAAHAHVQHDTHPARLFAVLVGETSKGRKGTGWSTPQYLFSLCDPDWVEKRIKSGLSSGEGLIYNVRDAVYKQEPIKERGRVVDYQTVCTDPGETDKRLLIIEPEFASTLTVMSREGNILSAVIRQAWDHGRLSPLTRNNPITASNAHISIVGHITKDELLARLDDTSKANGFANRFLWALVKRSKELPEGAAVPEDLLLPLADRLREVITFSRTVSVVKRDEEARALWHAVYHDLSEGKPGLLGAVLSRAEAQVLRLSIIYALLDMSAVVRVEHLQAALAVWEYCERSATLIFGKRLGDPTADRILEALRNAGVPGLDEKQIYDLFSGHKSANERARALNLLAQLGLATSTQEETGGRPRTVWRAA